MIVLADSEGPEQTAQADLGPRCSHMPEYTFSHYTEDKAQVRVRVDKPI